MDALLHDPAFWLLALFIIPLLFRVPIALALGFSALVVVWKWDMGVNMLSYNFFAGIAKFPLLAIPFFILAGYIMERAGIAARIVALMEALVGSMTGGLAVATVAVATFWGAVSGSGPATVAALGLILIPGMAKAGYNKAFATATVSVTSGLAIVIPPSIAFIVYGGVADVSVPALFAAGFVPGVIVAFFIMGAVLLISRKRGYKGKPRQQPIGKALRESFWGIMTPVVILGGIYGGVFTPTEAAAVAVVYALPIGFLVYKGLTMKSFLDAAKSSATAVGAIMIMIVFSLMLSQIFVMEQIPQAMVETIFGITQNKVVLLILINLLLFFIGMIVNDVTAIILTAPLLLPLMQAIGVSPIHFAAIMGVNTAMGGVTPPYASILYLGMRIGKVEFSEIIKPAMILLIFGYVPVVFLTAFWPDLALFLPRLLGY